MGRARLQPMVKLDAGSDPRMAVLRWTELRKGDQYAGELLAACELMLVSFPLLLVSALHVYSHSVI